MVQPVTAAEFRKWNTADASDIEPLLERYITNPNDLDAVEKEHLEMLLMAFDSPGGYYYSGYRFILTDEGRILGVRIC